MLKNVYAAYVATPATHHAERVVHALESRIPVLCEKPLCANIEDVERVLSAAQLADTLLVEAQWNRFTPLFVAVLQEILNGKIGEVKGLAASFGKPIKPNMGHRLYDRNLGGAALMDLGIYPVSLAHAVFDGELIAISESAVEFSSGVDIEFSATLHYGEGSKVCIAASIGRYFRRARACGHPELLATGESVDRN